MSDIFVSLPCDLKNAKTFRESNEIGINLPLKD